MIKRGQAITLSDNVKYLVISKIEYEGNSYLFLSSMDDNHKIMICQEKEGKVINITDDNLVKELISLFDKDVQSLL